MKELDDTQFIIYSTVNDVHSEELNRDNKGNNSVVSAMEMFDMRYTNVEIVVALHEDPLCEDKTLKQIKNL